MNKIENFEYKLKEIRRVLSEKECDGVEIKSQANFSFLTRGRGFIGLASVVACGSLIVTKENVYLVTENIEAMRLYNEQLDNNPLITVIDFPWHESSKRDEAVKKVTNGLKIISEGDIEKELFNMRTLMTSYDYEDYKALCQESAIILENICKNLKKGMTEYELAGEIAKQFWSNNIEPITILIGFDDRALKYRHPVMAGATLENYALVGICGRRNGLIVSISRDVLINSDKEMEGKHNKCARVNAAFLNSLKIGKTMEEVFEVAVKQYEVEGYPLEYVEHHQGGLTGFIPREIRANKGCLHKVRENEAYAFNPTIQGSKCEDTVFVTKNGLENLTHTGNYSYVECDVLGEKIIVPTVYVINK